MQFLQEELKVKNHLLERTMKSKKIYYSTTFPARNQIESQTQIISDEKNAA